MYLATETILIHKSHIVKLTGRFRPNHPFTYFTHRCEQLRDVININMEADCCPHTLVMTTISSRGRLSALMALPRYTSERPFEYTFAVSKVFTPCSYLIGARETVVHVRTKRVYSREFYMLGGLFLAEDPRLPTRIAVRHHAKNDPGHFQPRLS